ncbi:MAG: LAGLIDADG homing endonuclease [Candidatus Nomurabacteria bacterium GW2011_GWA1_46_11]|uniref:LAGLIDADG homing endonuclease n=1 Tax=Candidatus Nomurabacteria bacterium GW2011_GWA1_46_11 TaxID=1618732 RepID=A0A0G1RHH1_9BACT|nr:MAG: LAGLIDADG homing endonuclease [Microgenomates group bacterium GW2011_GWA2_44_7]KKU20375.1 MAG: LAGLIDADG homing endonuclease [Candidatus Nomurabacteria bacterium GW2011_GWA1_46_11]
MDFLTREQKEILVGCVLGDARLESRSSQKTARLRIHHADSQRDYLLWKFEKFKNLTLNVPKKNIYLDRRYGTQVVSWYFHTQTLDSLGKYFTMFYREGKKIIPRNLEVLLTPLTLAIWIMDDGSLNRESLVINSQSFSDEEHQFIINCFRRRYGVEIRLQRDRNNKRIYFPRNSTDRIENIIFPYLIDPELIPVETDVRQFRTEI